MGVLTILQFCHEESLRDLTRKIGKNARKRENDANAHVTWKIYKTAKFNKPPFFQNTERNHMLIVDVWSPNQITRSRKWDNFPPNSDAKYPLSFLKISTHQFLIFVDFVLKNPSQTPSWFIQSVVTLFCWQWLFSCFF